MAAVEVVLRTLDNVTLLEETVDRLALACCFYNFKGVRVLHHPEISSILGRLHFSAVRKTFLAEEEAENVANLPDPKFLPFLGRPRKDVRHFGTPSLVTFLTFQNVTNPHLNT